MDRQMTAQLDGSWNVWCQRHGKRYTMTAVGSREEARTWWREHTGRTTNETWCPQPVDITFDRLEFPEVAPDTDRKVVCPTCGTQELRRMDWTTMSGLCENKHMIMWDGFKAEWYNPNQANA